jgi:hypothetical protein
MMLTVTLPLKTVSENKTMREHRMAMVRRAQAQRSGVCVAVRPQLRREGFIGEAHDPSGAAWPVIVLPLVVTFTRLSAGELDDDNLRGAMKSVRDGMADALGLRSDRDPRVRWEYAQGRGSKAVPYGVRIEVRPREIEAERPRAGGEG